VIDTEQSVSIGVPIGQVWDYANDIGRWANFMPGLVGFELQGPDDSRWTLKVGAGALVRTVKVVVHVERWAGPEQAIFSYRLEGDPVQGGGSYTARPLGPDRTEVALAIRVEGTGPMAPMWEALGKPLLPKFAAAFADQLKQAIEAANSPAGASQPIAEETSIWARLLAWLRGFFRKTREA
jgi:carbon monoxide dehydrogenase subunit G